MKRFFDFELKYMISLKNLAKVAVVPKKYTKLIKRNLKSITSINNMKLFLTSKDSNFNFEPSFIGIHQVLRVIWPFEHEFQSRI